MRCRLEPILATMKTLEANSGLLRMIKETNRNQELMQASLGSFEDLRRASIFDQTAELAAVSRQVLEGDQSRSGHVTDLKATKEVN